jgi:hypothetical protein
MTTRTTSPHTPSLQRTVVPIVESVGIAMTGCSLPWIRRQPLAAPAQLMPET